MSDSPQEKEADSPRPSEPQPDPSSAAAGAQELTTKVLDFLSTASNETLGACAVGLGAATYFALGRVGLVLIGAVGGVVLHATWEGSRASDKASLSAERKRRREVGVDVVKRLLDWQDKRKDATVADSSATDEIETKLAARKELTFEGFEPQTKEALTLIVDRVINDYVKWWYSPILPTDVTFPNASRQTLMAFILSFSSHLSRKRAEEIFLHFLTNSTSMFIVFLSELSKALMASGASAADPVGAITLYLETNPESNFANVLDRKEQRKKLKAVSEDILRAFLDSKAYNCEPVKVFLREVLAGLILEATLQSCSKPEWINGWIVYLLEQGEPEIMNAINAGVGDATVKGSTEVSAQIEPEQKVQLAREAVEAAPGGDDATKLALEEAKRLSQMIASEDAKRLKQQEESVSSAPSENLLTPTSSHSDLVDAGKVEEPHESKPDSGTTPEDSIVGQHADAAASFTSFDQLVLPERSSTEPVKPPPLTLHKAIVSIFDDSQPGEKGNIRSKPNIDYLLQVEPASSQHPGWMIARKYADFETLHEVLRRISVISGVPEFTIKFATIPGWKNKTKSSLRIDLEAYLREALSHQRLAESEGMKRFLEKDEGLEKLSNSKGLLGFPTPEAFQTMGKGMLDVLASAPKGAAGGGKALLDGVRGVSGVFGGQKKGNPSRPPSGSRQGSTANLPRMSEDRRPSSSRSGSISSTNRIPEGSATDLPWQSNRMSLDVSKPPPLPSRPSSDAFERHNTWSSSMPGGGSQTSLPSQADVASIAETEAETKAESSSLNPIDEKPISLPPRPSEIDDDDDFSVGPQGPTVEIAHEDAALGLPPSLPERPKAEPVGEASTAAQAEPSSSKAPKKAQVPLTTEETQVAVELIFAVINELYTLSSAWNIRRTLLNAAKTFLLRPGNPSLEQIRVLLQEQVIEANKTDAGIATQLRKLRENSLPTEAELAAWPPPPSEEEKERLRVKARKLLVEQGMPPALRSVMGAAASGEALGRLFDSLQVEEVSRGLMFAVMLQGVKAVTH